MCGRYNIIPDAPAWISAFALPGDEASAISEWPPRYNVAPSQDVPIIRMNPEKPVCEMLFVRWGLVPFWAKDPKIGARMINARAETVTEKPAFRTAFRKRRCLVPANGFYEWQKRGPAKQPWLIRTRYHSPFAFAGLWESWRDPLDGHVLLSCSIIVTEANGFMRRIHDRMPVILNPRDYGRWLDPDRKDGAALLAACPDEWLEAHPVSTFVNNPRNDDARCIEAVEVL